MIARILAGSLAIGSIFLSLDSTSLGQPGGGWDPKAMFDRMANGKEFIVISEVNPFFRDRLVKFAQANNISNDRLTFDQYKTYMEQRAKEGGFKKGNSGDGSKKGGDGFRKGNGNEGGTKPSAPATTRSSEKPAPAESVPAAPEYSTRVIIEGDLERRPVVFRAGKLPAGLPEWFKELDLDSDGQVDLGEWRQGERSIADFRAIDLNNDGLLTPEEVLRHQARAEKASTTSESSEGTTSENGGGTTTTGATTGSGKKGGGNSPYGTSRFGRKKSSR
jgi:hypothetical protein